MFQLLEHDELDSAASPGIALFGYFPVVFQLLEQKEFDPAASAGGQDLGTGFLSRSSCWNTKRSILLPILVVWIWAGISAVFQLMEHEDPDPAANFGGQEK